RACLGDGFSGPCQLLRSLLESVGCRTKFARSCCRIGVRRAQPVIRGRLAPFRSGALLVPRMFRKAHVEIFMRFGQFGEPSSNSNKPASAGVSTGGVADIDRNWLCPRARQRANSKFTARREPGLRLASIFGRAAHALKQFGNDIAGNFTPG